jgi:hypothetical protein
VDAPKSEGRHPGSILRSPAVPQLAALALAILLLARNSPRELSARVRSIVAYAPRELAVRRLGGSGAAFDRRFFIFLEAARRKLPKQTSGVVLSMPEPSSAPHYLAAYQMAPVPVAMAPESAPSGWIVARYGADRPAGFRVIAEVPGGALLEPPIPSH